MPDPVLHPLVCARAGGADAGVRALAGGWASFRGVEDLAGGGAPPRGCMGVDEAERRFPERMEALVAGRGPFAGLDLGRPHVVGVVNVTPDSFFDGGRYADAADAVERVHELAAAGASVIEVGGESTRPGAEAVPVGEELRRALPVVEAAAGTGLPVSVDTRRAEVMREAVAAGASIVNDVTALSGDGGALEAVAASGASAVLMHMQGTPATMQSAPRYRVASADVFGWLAGRVRACLAAGIGLGRLCVDPGVGFGKDDAHNADILGRAALFHGLGCAVMVGVSRKSFIGRIAGAPRPEDRLAGTVMATAAALARGVQLHRVHDVADIRQALAVWRALADAGRGGRG